ncbi:MAG TPA: hypothetical protein VGM87_12395 [Roseomonas sp.]
MLELLDGLQLPDQLFWLICAGFFLAEQVRLHGSRLVFLVVGAAGGWRLAGPVPGWRLGGRSVTLLNPLLPFLGVVQLPWLGTVPHAPRDLRRAGRLLAIRRRLLLPYRVLAVAEGLALFLAGPLLTTRHGPGAAFLLILPLHLACALCFCLVLAAQRRAWRIGWGQVAARSFECLLSPGSLANACRRVSLALPPPDVDAIALAASRPDAARTVAPHLAALLDEWEQDGMPREEDREAVARHRQALAELQLLASEALS